MTITDDESLRESQVALLVVQHGHASDHEELLRRYAAPDHIIKDKGTGEIVFRSTALRWDPDGCSVYREMIMSKLNLSAHEDDYPYISSIVVDDVRKFVFDGMTPFEVTYSPRALSGLDVAHTSICLLHEDQETGGYPSKGRLKAAKKALAVRFILEKHDPSILD